MSTSIIVVTLKSTFEERSAGNPRAAFCGSQRRVTASGDPVSGETDPGKSGNRAFDRPYYSKVRLDDRLCLLVIV